MGLNWSLCIICQRHSGECLKYPSDNAVSSINTVGPYLVFLDTVPYLRTIDAPPVILRFSTEETAENIARHNAGWHKSCRNKFSKSKMQRNMFIASHRIKKLPKVEDERRLCKRKCLNAEKCIFCEQDHEIKQLSSVQTFEQDSNIRTMATDFQDVEIMARISGGDMIAIEAKYHLSF